MPIETKKRAEKASRKGKISAPTWWLSGDSLITAPATNAPSASDTPNSSAEARAVPSAMARMARMNSSRDLRPRQGRHQHQDQHRNEVFHHQPPNSGLPVGRI
jgi:hypothetical protein